MDGKVEDIGKDDDDDDFNHDAKVPLENGTKETKEKRTVRTCPFQKLFKPIGWFVLFFHQPPE